MANSPKASKRRVIKRSPSVREKAVSQSANPKPKRRVLHSTAGQLSRPIRRLAPIAKPFKAKPLRFTARVIGFILWPPFFRGAWNELRQVTWPNRNETWRLTAAVFVFALIFGLLIAITDYGLDNLFRKVILK